MAKAKVISVANQKGGVGKSTSVYCIGAGLVSSGKRVLLVDLDPQGDLTKMLGLRKPHDLPCSLETAMNDVVAGKQADTHPEIHQHHEGFDFISGKRSLSAVEVGLVNVMSRETVLRQYLDSIKGNYDYVLLDCRPSLGMLVINALAASDYAACTTLISGPHTTDANGKISVTGLIPQTVYVKELGHTDSAINALYSCGSTNPQKVELVANQTATVNFYNKLNLGGVKLIKTTNTGNNLGGWSIGLYTDAACHNPVSGSPFTTAADGTITVTGLKPSTYYAKELPGGDSYWVCDTAVKTVTVVANQTASVTFTNTHYGRIAVQKHTNTGNHLGGWVFTIRNSNGDIVAELTTDDNGYAVTGNLPLGKYTIQEKYTDDDYWQVELGFHDVTVKAGETVVDEWTNIEQGLGWFYKETNTAASNEGWEITIYTDEACTQESKRENCIRLQKSLPKQHYC